MLIQLILQDYGLEFYWVGTQIRLFFWVESGSGLFAGGSAPDPIHLSLAAQPCLEDGEQQGKAISILLPFTLRATGCFIKIISGLGLLSI